MITIILLFVPVQYELVQPKGRAFFAARRAGIRLGVADRVHEINCAMKIGS